MPVPSLHQPKDGDHHGDLEDTAQASRLDEHLDESKQSQQQQPDRVQEPPCRLRVPPLALHGRPSSSQLEGRGRQADVKVGAFSVKEWSRQGSARIGKPCYASLSGFRTLAERKRAHRLLSTLTSQR